MIKIPQALVIEPSSELTFRGRLREVSSTTLFLSNPSCRTVYFKVKTNAPIFFAVSPNVGFISPGASLSIEIERYPTDTAKKYEIQRHSFMIQSAFASSTIVPPKEFWKNAETVEIMETKLRVMFTEGIPNSPTVVQPPGIQTNTRDPVSLQSETELRERAQNNVDLEPKESSWIEKFWSMLLFGQFADDGGYLDSNQQIIGLLVVFVVVILVGFFVLSFLPGNAY